MVLRQRRRGGRDAHRGARRGAVNPFQLGNHLIQGEPGLGRRPGGIGIFTGATGYKIQNNIIAGNSAEHGGGVQIRRPTSLVNNTFGFSDTISLIHGNHNFKFGTGVSAYQNNTVFDFIVNGEFDFFGGTTGNSLADFLLGAPDEFFQAPAAPSNIRSKSSYAFLQDEWRATKRLSINLGVRYEYNSPKLDVAGRSFSIRSLASIRARMNLTEASRFCSIQPRFM